MLRKRGRAIGRGRLFSCVLSVCAFVLLVAVPAAAFAFHTDGRETRGGTVAYTCADCHVTWAGGDDDGDTAKDGAGPHGYYRSDTDKCRMCHTVHKAPASSILLLPAATIQGACFTCHDNTGAAGVYSAITARGGSVVASHSIETTTNVPGGSFDLTAKLGCTSCHSVHRATTVEAFRTDRDLPMAGGAKYSNALLRDDVGGKPRGTYTKYGADWCAGCHDQRHSGGTIVNHPTESSAVLDAFNYGRVAVVLNLTSSTTEVEDEYNPGGGLGATNRGYVMPYPRTTNGINGQGAHKPICQQCHEDARNVGSVGAVVPFKPSFFDVSGSGDATNPLVYSFPHQSDVRRFLVEDNDDLCLNCHPLAQLP